AGGPRDRGGESAPRQPPQPAVLAEQQRVPQRRLRGRSCEPPLVEPLPHRPVGVQGVRAPVRDVRRRGGSGATAQLSLGLEEPDVEAGLSGCDRRDQPAQPASDDGELCRHLLTSFGLTCPEEGGEWNLSGFPATPY